MPPGLATGRRADSLGAACRAGAAPGTRWARQRSMHGSRWRVCVLGRGTGLAGARQDPREHVENGLPVALRGGPSLLRARTCPVGRPMPTRRSAPPRELSRSAAVAFVQDRTLAKSKRRSRKPSPTCRFVGAGCCETHSGWQSREATVVHQLRHVSCTRDPDGLFVDRASRR
jgi:hypothetical protein